MSQAEWTITWIQISIFCQTSDFEPQTLVTSLTVAIAKLSAAAGHTRVLQQNPHTVPYPHPFGKQQRGK